MAGSPLEDPRITAVGLLIEAHDGLQRRLEAHLRDHNFARAEFDALLRLARSHEGRLRITDLAAQLSLSNSGASRLVDRLVARGCIERRSCDTDARVAYAVITDVGRQTIEEAIGDHLELIERWYTGVLEPDELATLNALLRKVRDVVYPGATAGT
jgi:DNA-binding MarR family transcriptional regulator